MTLWGAPTRDPEPVARIAPSPVARDRHAIDRIGSARSGGVAGRGERNALRPAGSVDGNLAIHRGR
jgi:hypothetical protein